MVSKSEMALQTADNKVKNLTEHVKKEVAGTIKLIYQHYELPEKESEEFVNAMINSEFSRTLTHWLSQLNTICSQLKKTLDESKVQE